MSITWRDGATTLAVAGAILIERAHSLDWGWPLVSDMRWAVAGIVVLTLAGFFFSYYLDTIQSTLWSVVTGILAASMTILAVVGLSTGDASYVVYLMINSVAFWVASLVRHLTIPDTMTHVRT